MGFGCAETPPAARFQCGVCCCSMYWRAMASGAPPELTAKSDGDHSAPFRSRFWMSDHPLRSKRPDTPSQAVDEVGDGDVRRLCHAPVEVDLECDLECEE